MTISNSTRCDECGTELTALNLWPFCGGEPKKHALVTHFGDDPIEGYVDGNLGPQDIEITTRGQRRSLMAKLGVEYKDVSRKKRGARLYFDMSRAR